jgi:hypothetical protein
MSQSRGAVARGAREAAIGTAVSAGCDANDTHIMSTAGMVNA